MIPNLRVSFLFSFMLLTLCAVAQNETEALRYSFKDNAGSARVTAMGGAFGALGGDLSALSINPAGIAVFRSSELSMSLGLNSHAVNTTFRDIENEQRQFGLNVPHIGLVGVTTSNNPNWSRVNFGISFNRTSSFNEKFISRGRANGNSFLEQYVSQANGFFGDELVNEFPFGAGLAWDTFLIDPIDTVNLSQYISANPGGEYDQMKTVTRNGHASETVVALGGVYQDVLHVGVTLGFPSISFSEESQYIEENLPANSELESFTQTETINTTGRGVNLKIGGIMKVTDYLRVGLAFHTPSILTITDTYDTEIRSNFKDGEQYTALSPLGNFEYRLRTPARYVVSAAYILGKSGIISADYEFINYRGANMRQSYTAIDPYNFSSENEFIDESFRGAHNVRLGAEMRLNKYLSLRGGFALQQSAEDPTLIANISDRMNYSGGIGYRKSGYFFDIAYRLATWQNTYFITNPQLAPQSSLDHRQGQFVVSFGIKY